MKLLFLLSIFLLNSFNIVFAMKQKELNTISYNFIPNGIYTNHDKLIAFNENNLFLFDTKTMLFQSHKTLPFHIGFAIPYHEEYYILSRNDFVLLKNDLIIPIKNPNYTNENKPNYSNVKLFNDKLFLISHEDCLIDIYEIETQKFTTLNLERRPIDIHFDEKTKSLFVLTTEPAEKKTYLIKCVGDNFENLDVLFLGTTIPDESEGNYLSSYQQKLYALLEKQIKVIGIEQFNIIEQINCAADESFLINGIYIDNGLLYCSYASNPAYMNDVFTDDEEHSDDDSIDDSIDDTNEDEELSNNEQLSEMQDETEEYTQLTENTVLSLPLINDETGNQTILDIIDLRKNKHLHRFAFENCINSFLIFNDNIFFEMRNTIECISKCITPSTIVRDKRIHILKPNALKHIKLSKKINIDMMQQKLFNKLNDYEDQFIVPSIFENLLKREISLHTPKLFRHSARIIDTYERAIILSKLVNNLNWKMYKKARNYMNFLIKKGYTSDSFALQLAYYNGNDLKDYFKLLALSEGSILEDTRNEKRIIFLKNFFDKIEEQKGDLFKFVKDLNKSISTTLILDKDNFEFFVAELTKCYELLSTDHERNIFKGSFIKPFLENMH
ncbi:MAG: hypothetical protein Q8S31_10525 [Alphaproteobacteria bacterium]|nr:hypothetical protein [Alphaproteobacteria bacterium]